MVNPLPGLKIWSRFHIVLFFCIVAEIVFMYLLKSEYFTPEKDMLQNVGSNHQFHGANNLHIDSNTKTTNFYQETTVRVRKSIIV